MAEDTKELAAATLEHLYSQGEQLRAITQDVDVMDEHIKESEGILRFLRRCFVCFPCCDGDPGRAARRRYLEKVKLVR